MLVLVSGVFMHFALICAFNLYFWPKFTSVSYHAPVKEGGLDQNGDAVPTPLESIAFWPGMTMLGRPEPLPPFRPLEGAWNSVFLAGGKDAGNGLPNCGDFVRIVDKHSLPICAGRIGIVGKAAGILAFCRIKNTICYRVQFALPEISG